MMSEPIRILHVIGIMNRGGAENMIMNLYRCIDRSKVQFDFVENDGAPAEFDEEIRSLGGRIFKCPKYRGKNHFAYVKWWHVFFREYRSDYRIVHGHIGSTAAIYLSIAKKYGAVAVAHSHSAGKGGVGFRLLSYPTRFVANQFFACSQDAAVSRYGKSVAGNTFLCRVLNNAVDTKKFAYSPMYRDCFRRELGLPEECLVIGHVGRFVKAKNHEFLIDIFEKVLKENGNSMLLLVGDGELRTEIEDIIKDKQLMNHVVFTGVQPDVWKYYQVMDIFVMPSLYEGLPVSMVEAQSAGLHCCVSTGVPKEAAITDLVDFMSLEESAERWAEWIFEKAKLSRRDTSHEVKAAGYDISETAKWLQDFYLENWKE